MQSVLQLELWHLISLLIAFFGACGAGGSLLLSLHQKHLDAKLEEMDLRHQQGQAQLTARLSSIEVSNREEAQQWQRVERELLHLKAELPINYVRREDQVRRDSIVEAKLDGLAAKFENAVLRMQVNGGPRASN